MNPIDIHSHLFNLKYLPVAGILRRYTNEIIPHRVAVGIEWFLIAKTASSFGPTAAPLAQPSSIKETPIVLRADVRAQFNVSSTVVPSDARKLFEMSQATLVDLVADKLTEADAQSEEVQAAMNEFLQQPDVAVSMGMAPASFRISSIRDNSPEMLMQGRNIFARMIDWVFDKIEAGLNYLRWFSFMTHSEIAILDALQRDQSGPSPVTRFLHMMMDVDAFFVDSRGREYKSTYDFVNQQIPNFRKLNKQFKDKLIGFVAFNPTRPNGLDVIKDALADGFHGVKFYPPLGYRATDNHDAIIEKRIADMLDYCDLKDIPVFTHCNNGGFQARPRDKSGRNSSPVFWEKVLQRHPTLRMCFGHAGGVEGWFTDNRPTDKSKAADITSAATKDDSHAQEMDWNASYAAMVFKLCVEKDNVYCDASYLDEMVTSSGALEPKPAEHFRTRLLKLFKDEPKFAKKIIYGSDWHMLFQEAKNATYFSTYVTFFQHPELKPYADDFFENNAKAFLKIVQV